MTRSTALLLATPPASIDRTLWLYELCRFLISQCNSLIVGFLFDTPPCSAATCPEMRASEWQFLCAVHDQPRSCCAIDYCCHTLDWAANVVTNPKLFPSRFVALSDAHDRGAGLKNLVNVFRRLHRIFAHAWFQHRGVFWQVEAQTGLYVFFKTVCDLYDLLPAENYKLPPEAEGLEGGAGALQDSASGGGSTPAVSVSIAGLGPERRSSLNTPIVTRPGASPLSPQPQQILQRGAGGGVEQGLLRGEPGSMDPSGGGSESTDPRLANTNTRRHIRSNPSVGSAVARIPEADEEGADVSSPSAVAGAALSGATPSGAPTTTATSGAQQPQQPPALSQGGAGGIPLAGPISAGLASTIEVTNKLREMHIADDDDDENEDEDDIDLLGEAGASSSSGGGGAAAEGAAAAEPEEAEVLVIVEDYVEHDKGRKQQQQQQEMASGKAIEPEADKDAEEGELVSVSTTTAPPPAPAATADAKKDEGVEVEGEGSKEQNAAVDEKVPAESEDDETAPPASSTSPATERLLAATNIHDFAAAAAEPADSAGTSSAAATKTTESAPSDKTDEGKSSGESPKSKPDAASEGDP